MSSGKEFGWKLHMITDIGDDVTYISEHFHQVSSFPLQKQGDCLRKILEFFNPTSYKA